MTKPFDPVAQWQEFVQKWEHEVNAWSGKLTEREEFSAVIGQATKLQFAAQKALTDRMDETLRSLNLPSKRQVDLLAERLDAIEESIERLRLMLVPGATPRSTSAEPAPSAPEPKRSRKPAPKTEPKA